MDRAREILCRGPGRQAAPSTLPEGVTAFWATATVSGVSSTPTRDYLVTVDLSAPVVTASVAATTTSLGPQVRVTASDLNALPNGTAVAIDVDLNNDGNFTDLGESPYASGTLTDGVALITLPALAALGTYALRARVTDRAGNQVPEGVYLGKIGSNSENPGAVTGPRSGGTWQDLLVC